MELTEPCPNCTNGVCASCDGSGIEMITVNGERTPRTYLTNEEFVQCNCTHKDASGIGKCNHCGGTGTITRIVLDYEVPSLDERSDTDIELDFDF
jgi:succinate dehydrogenase/fumarate reductase flavoprotein subunit